MNAGVPPKEIKRLEALKAYHILDTPPERVFDDIVRLAALICGTPIALMSLIDEKRQWFKSKVGLTGSETSRDIAFCAHAILDPGHVLVVQDATLDKRFSENPFVLEDPKIRFYAGAPLVDPEGQALGTLCVIDRTARILNAEQLEALRVLSRLLMVQMELNQKMSNLARFQKLSVGRELDMIRMKTEVNDLLKETSRPPRYVNEEHPA